MIIRIFLSRIDKQAVLVINVGRGLSSGNQDDADLPLGCPQSYSEIQILLLILTDW